MHDLKAGIFSALTSDADLVALVPQSSAAGLYGVYFSIAPSNCVMPYIVFHFVADSNRLAFESGSDSRTQIVQFTIVDDADNSDGIDAISERIENIFDRTELIFTTIGHMGNVRIGGSGPTKLEDCFERILDYRFTYRATKDVQGSDPRLWKVEWGTINTRAIYSAYSVELDIYCVELETSHTSSDGKKDFHGGLYEWEGQFNCNISDDKILPEPGEEISELTLTSPFGRVYQGDAFIKRLKINVDLEQDISTLLIQFRGTSELVRT